MNTASTSRPRATGAALPRHQHPKAHRQLDAERELARDLEVLIRHGLVTVVDDGIDCRYALASGQEDLP